MRLTKLLPTLIPPLVVVALAWPGQAQTKPPAEPEQAQPAEPCGAPADASSAEAWYWLGKEQGQEGNSRCAMEAYAHSWELRPSYDSAGNGGMHAAVVGEHALVCKLLSYSLANIPASLDEPKKQVAGERMRKALEESLRHVGRARVETKPGALILVDGQPAGTAPLNPPELCLPPGSRTIEARLEGFQPAKATIEVKIGPPLSLELPLQPAVAEPPQPPTRPKPVPDEGPSIPLVVAGSAVAVAAIGAGAGLLAASAEAASDRDDKLAALGGQGSCTTGNPFVAECDEIRDLAQAAMTFRGAGIAMLITGGVAGAATLGYALWPRETAAETAAVAVFPAGLGGLLLRGAWWWSNGCCWGSSWLRRRRCSRAGRAAWTAPTRARAPASSRRIATSSATRTAASVPASRAPAASATSPRARRVATTAAEFATATASACPAAPAAAAPAGRRRPGEGAPAARVQPVAAAPVVRHP